MKQYDFLILGAGIFGITTAVELCKKKYFVAIINPGKIPHPLAESTDISKIIRMEYGTDEEYMNMAAECIIKWREWNDFFNDKLFHETGFLLLSQRPIDSASKSFESASYYNLLKRGFKPERINTNELAKKYPAFNHEKYADGFYHAVGGFAESGRVVETLTKYAKQLGADIFAVVGSLPKAARLRWYEAMPCAEPTNESESFQFNLLYIIRKMDSFAVLISF